MKRTAPKKIWVNLKTNSVTTEEPKMGTPMWSTETHHYILDEEVNRMVSDAAIEAFKDGSDS